MKMKKILALLIAVFMMVSVVACNSNNQNEQNEQNERENDQNSNVETKNDNDVANSNNGEPEVEKKDPVEIVIWTTVGEDNELPVLEKVCANWEQETGNTVKIVMDESEDQFTSFMQAAGTKNGPDINFGTPNDVLGLFNAAGLLDEVPEGVVNFDEYVDVAVDAVTLNGKKYALPWALETMALYYNADLVEKAPETWDEFITVAKDVGFMIDAPKLYFSYPIISGAGGYIFKYENGTLNTSDVGLGEQSRKAYEIIDSLYNEYDFMAADVDFNIAKSNFQSGEIGLYIGGIWDAFGFMENEVNFELGLLPTIDGNRMKPFTGCKTAIVSSKSKVKEQAWELIAYIAKNSVMDFYDAGMRLPVLKSAGEDPKIIENPVTKAFLEQAKYSDAIPNIPEMNAIWAPCMMNIQALVNGQATVDDIITNIPNQINENIQSMNE